MLRRYSLSLVIIILCLSWIPAHGGQETIIFDDSAPDYMRLSNEFYEIRLSKTNGALTGLVDRTAGVNLTQGSRHGCAWGAVFPDTTQNYVGGCSYASGGSNRFSYAWNAANHILTLSYSWQAGAAQRVDATVTVTASEAPDSIWRIIIQNNWGHTAANVIFPVEWIFNDRDVEAAYTPYLLPGTKLSQGFFTENRTYVPTYPGDAAFASYLGLSIRGGNLAFYMQNPDPNPLQPVALGFIDDESTQPGTFYAYYSMHTWIRTGESWQSPPVHVHVGQTHEQAILAYRQDNGIAAYPSLSDKLGAALLAGLAQAPLVRADSWRIDKPFLDWINDLDRFPGPVLLHPAAYQPRGHDENYPDFLPPDPQWGTAANFRTLVNAAHARGMFVMPYINPTWWDDESPTLQNLPPPLTVADVAVLDENGRPVYETYSGHGGYVVSPYVPFVQQRLASLMAQWVNDVPVDCVFEDQIGARVWRRDFNPVASNPQHYSDGWLAHTSTYSPRCLMTEMGWDRLARTEVGFHGSLLTWAREFDYANAHWGAGNWQPYPMALWLFHDKVLFYQHDLADSTFSSDNGVLTWNMAFGAMLSYDWQWADNNPLTNPWLNLVVVLQRAVGARYAGKPLTGFTPINANVTQSRFGDLAITANWHPTLTYDSNGYRIVAGGFMARTDSESVLAGIFTAFFNGSLLSAGEHYLLLERTSHSVTVRQPVGADTVLAVDAPAAWQPGHTLHVWAKDRNGNTIGEVGYWVEGRVLRFRYQQQVNGQNVDWYEIVNSFTMLLPQAMR